MKGKQNTNSKVVMQFECGTRILRVIHGRDARATLSNCTTTEQQEVLDWLPASGIQITLPGKAKDPGADEGRGAPGISSLEVILL